MQLRLEIKAEKAQEQKEKEYMLPMRKKLNRNSPIHICGRRGINGLIPRETQEFGMSECNGMQTLMVQGKGDFWTFRREKRLKNITSQLHSKVRDVEDREVVPWEKTWEKIKNKEERARKEETRPRGNVGHNLLQQVILCSLC